MIKERGSHLPFPLPEKLDRNDLKLRSIQQMKNFPEFDIIIDTIGELHYTEDSEDNIYNFLIAIISKLTPGGKAFINSPLLGSFGENRNIEDDADRPMTRMLREQGYKLQQKFASCPDLPTGRQVRFTQ